MSEAMNDVKEAAERLSEGWQKYVNAFGEPPHGTVRQMAGLLSFAGLFPADSDEPITAEWLREMGFSESDDGFAYWGLHLIRWGSEWRLQIGGVNGMWEYLPHRTRGAVRQLLSALSIQPTSKETT